MSLVLSRDNGTNLWWISKKTAWVQDDVKTSFELLEFSIWIWKNLKWLNVNTWTMYTEMMKILYRRAVFEIWELSKREHRYNDFLILSERLIEDLFSDNFVCYLQDEWVNVDENKELISSIYNKVRDFIRNHQ